MGRILLSFLTVILFEYSFNPGIYFRAGLESDYSVVPEIIQSIEVGIAVDAYLNEIEIMANNSPSYYFATLYLNFSLGNKFYWLYVNN